MNIYEEFAELGLEFIADCHEDSGILRGCMELATESQRGWIDHFIRVNDIEIAQAMEDLAYDRRRAVELDKLQWTGQSSFDTRNEGDDRHEKGFDNNGKVEDSDSGLADRWFSRWGTCHHQWTNKERENVACADANG
jgi:hypothetical protein